MVQIDAYLTMSPLSVTMGLLCGNVTAVGQADAIAGEVFISPNGCYCLIFIDGIHSKEFELRLFAPFSKVDLSSYRVVDQYRNQLCEARSDGPNDDCLTLNFSGPPSASVPLFLQR